MLPFAPLDYFLTTPCCHGARLFEDVRDFGTGALAAAWLAQPLRSNSTICIRPNRGRTQQAKPSAGALNSPQLGPPQLDQTAHIDPTAGNISEGIPERHRRGARHEDESSGKGKAYNQRCLLTRRGSDKVLYLLSYQQ